MPGERRVHLGLENAVDVPEVDWRLLKRNQADLGVWRQQTKNTSLRWQVGPPANVPFCAPQ